MLKYFRESGGPQSGHGGHLLWPGTVDGFPVRSDSPLPPDLRQGEFEQLQLVLDFKSREFRLWLPEEKTAFDDVMDRIVNSWYMQKNRRDRDTPEGLAVWLEWVQIYGETPTGKTPPGVPVNVSRPTPQLVASPTRSVLSGSPLGQPEGG